MVLGFNGEADGRVLSVEVIQESVHVIPFYDSGRVVYRAFPDSWSFGSGTPPCKGHQ